MVFTKILLTVLPVSCLISQVCCFGTQPVWRPVSGRSAGLYLAAASPELTAVERHDLSDSFSRWRYMQNFLDEEVEADDINEILYILLDNYKNARKVDPDDTSAPERTVELLQVVDDLLDKYAGSIPVLKGPGCTAGDKDVLAEVEQLLPDPVDKEDAAKGAWDTVGELLGKSSLSYNEREGRQDWRAVFAIARVMIYFELLTGEGLKR